MHVDPGRGVPDGMALDAEGGMWVAINGGHTVHRYTAEGKLDAVVEVPPSQVTSCAFGGEDLDRLYITTSREDLPPSAEPQAGAVFHATPGVRGLPDWHLRRLSLGVPPVSADCRWADCRWADCRRAPRARLLRAGT